MSAENDKSKEQTNEKEQKLRVVVDRSAEIEALQTQLQKITEEAKVKSAEAERLAKEKSELETLKGNIQTEKDSLEATLKTISEKEFNAKKEAVLSRVKTAFKEDESRVKEIESRLNDPEKGPENLKQTEYMMVVLEDSIKKGVEEIEKVEKARKEKEAAAQAATGQKAPEGGETAKLNQAQQTGGAAQAKTGEPSYDSYEAMIRDLRARARDSRDPVKQAEAEAILKELWKKWGKAVHSDFEKKTHPDGAIVTDYEKSVKEQRDKSLAQEGKE